MARYTLKNKLLAVMIALVFCSVFSTEAFAWQDRNQNGRQGVRHNEVQHGVTGRGGDNRKEFHRDGLFWGGVALSALAVTAIIASFPRQRETVYVESNRVIPEPVVLAQRPVNSLIQPQYVSAGSVVINVPNGRGGYTPVMLTSCEGGYLGPQGEFYPGNPTLGQLQVLYGL